MTLSNINSHINKATVEINHFYNSLKTKVGNLNQTQKNLLIASAAAAALTPLIFLCGRQTNNSCALDIYRPPVFGFTPVTPEFFSEPLVDEHLTNFILEKQVKRDYQNRHKILEFYEKENPNFEQNNKDFLIWLVKNETAKIKLSEEVASIPLEETLSNQKTEDSLTDNNELILVSKTNNTIKPIEINKHVFNNILNTINNINYLTNNNLVTSFSNLIGNINPYEISNNVFNVILNTANKTNSLINNNLSISNLVGRIKPYEITKSILDGVLKTFRIGISIFQVIATTSKYISFPLIKTLQSISSVPKFISFPLAAFAYQKRAFIKEKYTAASISGFANIFFKMPHKELKISLINNVKKAVLLKHDPAQFRSYAPHIFVKEVVKNDDQRSETIDKNALNEKLTFADGEPISLEPGHFLIPFEVTDENLQYTFPFSLIKKNVSCTILIPSNVFLNTNKVELKFHGVTFSIEVSDEDQEKIIKLADALYAKQSRNSIDDITEELHNEWKKQALTRIPGIQGNDDSTKLGDQLLVEQLKYIERQKSLWLGTVKYENPFKDPLVFGKKEEKEKEVD